MGFAFSRKAGGTVDWAASGEIHAHVKNGTFDIGVSGKLADAIGPIFAGNLQAGRFNREAIISRPRQSGQEPRIKPCVGRACDR
jgi:hypothetical protein